MWLISLAEITPDQLTTGMHRLVKSGKEWPPSAPEFRQMCLPTLEDLGIPPLQIAYKEASLNARRVADHQWTHPIVYWAADLVDFHKMRSESTRYTEPRFKSAYEELCRQALNGQRFVLPHFAENRIEKKPDCRTAEQIEHDKESGNRAISKLKDLFKEAPNEPV